MKNLLILLICIVIITPFTRTGVKNANAFQASNGWKLWKITETTFRGNLGIAVYSKIKNIKINGQRVYFRKTTLAEFKKYTGLKNLIPDGIPDSQLKYSILYPLCKDLKSQSKPSPLCFYTAFDNENPYKQSIFIYNYNGIVEGGYEFYFFSKKSSKFQFFSNNQVMMMFDIGYWGYGKGENGLYKNKKKEIYWLKRAANAGSNDAKKVLASLSFSQYKHLISKAVKYNNTAVKNIVRVDSKALRKLSGNGPLYACFNNVCALNITKAFDKNTVHKPYESIILLNKAKNYALSALTIAMNSQKQEVYGVLSNIYFNLGDKYAYWKCELSHDKIAMESQNGNIFYLSDIGKDYYELKDYDEAIKYLNLSMLKVKNSHHHWLKNSSLETDNKYLGLIYYHEKKFNLALKYSKRAYAYYESEYNKHHSYLLDKENAEKVLKLIDKIQNIRS